MANHLFIIDLHYTAPIEKIDEYIVLHRDYLDRHYASGHFLASGPKKPRTGGVIIAQASDQGELDAIMQNDPFLVAKLATYKITEFVAVKSAAILADFFKQ